MAVRGLGMAVCWPAKAAEEDGARILLTRRKVEVGFAIPLSRRR